MNAALRLIHELALSIGVPDLVPDSDGDCALRIDGEFDINLKATGDRVVVFSVVGVLHEHDNQRARQLLEANLFGQGTGGALLGIDNRQPANIILSRSFDVATTTSQGLAAHLHQLIDESRAWIAQCGPDDAAAVTAPHENNAATYIPPNALA